MVIKAIIVLLLMFIIFNLFKALVIMMKGDPEAPSMSTFLGRRVFISVAVLVFVVIALSLGWITPHQTPFTAHKQIQTDTTKPHQQSANTKQLPEKQSDSLE